MKNFEKPGAFYLGKVQDPAGGAATEELLLYDANDLTTHALVLGMTGSGKTGLATVLLEEAAIDGIPAILIDPKGDLGNLLLQFPELRPADFRPWVDETEALRKGQSADAFAAATADLWRKGLARWGQDGERIRRLQASAEVAVYTPGNTSVRPLRVLGSFAAPSPALVQDSSALRERILPAVSGLLGLLGRDADPVRSRDHILLSHILDRAWRAGRSLDVADIIHEVRDPPFERVGVFDLESFYPARDRAGLAMGLNNLVASPGFAAWTEGEPIDIRRLLRTSAGKPRLSILHLAHLTDAERMFFVTILLNEVIAWMRAQSGTGSLRALLYMDEIFGFFPPTANPPAKVPMLTLLKQARAFGLGVVLSTQNPVDLDYKGIANCGTWFVGRLQTERDRMRVIEGLEGAAAASGAGFDRARTERLLAGLGNRVFLMRNVHEDEPVLFQTRWTMSYLRGPMTLPQLAVFARSSAPAAAKPAPASAGTASFSSSVPAAAAAMPARFALPPGVPVFYRRPANPAGPVICRPRVLGVVKLHFVAAEASLDTWVTRTYLAPFSPAGDAAWEEAAVSGDISAELGREPPAGAVFAELPAAALNPRSYSTWSRELGRVAHQTATLELLTSAELKLAAAPGETEGDFRVRVGERLRETRDAEVARLEAKYTPKLQTLADQLRRATERVEREKAQAGRQKMNTAISIGATLLGAFLGRGIRSAGSVGRAATAARSAGRIGQEQADVVRAEENAEVLRKRLDMLQARFDAEVAALRAPVAPDAPAIRKRVVRPRKSDIAIGPIGICWTPWRQAADGTLEPA
jgi:hypothetical protein